MNPEVNAIIQESESRYLTKDEMATIVQFTNSLPLRFKAMGEVQKKEDEIITGVIKTMRERYPSFERFHTQAWEKGYRDLQLCLRYTVQAMVWDDPGMQEEKYLHWLARILASFNFTPKFNRDCYTLLRESVRRAVSSKTFQMLEPFLEKNIDVLGSIAEPAVAMV